MQKVADEMVEFNELDKLDRNWDDILGSCYNEFGYDCDDMEFTTIGLHLLYIINSNLKTN